MKGNKKEWEVSEEGVEREEIEEKKEDIKKKKKIVNREKKKGTYQCTYLHGTRAHVVENNRVRLFENSINTVM